MCSFKSAVIFLGLDSISYIPRSIKLIAVKLSIKPQRVNGLDRSSCVVFFVGHCGRSTAQDGGDR